MAAGSTLMQTDLDAAEMVPRKLKNGQAVLSSEAGHAVTRLSQCAPDVAFGPVEDLSAPVIAACAADLEPKFHIPTKAQ